MAAWLETFRQAEVHFVTWRARVDALDLEPGDGLAVDGGAERFGPADFFQPDLYQAAG